MPGALPASTGGHPLAWVVRLAAAPTVPGVTDDIIKQHLETKPIAPLPYCPCFLRLCRFIFFKMAKKDTSTVDFITDFMLGGVSGAIAKTCTAPIERVKLIIQARSLNS